MYYTTPVDGPIGAVDKTTPVSFPSLLITLTFHNQMLVASL